MRYKTGYVLLFVGLLFLASCNKLGKKPVACFSASNVTPELNETIIINGDCSKDTKWADYFIDGIKIGNSAQAVSVLCSVPGAHELSMTAYSKSTGSGGEGKTASSTLSIFVTAPFAANSNAPIYYGETLQLTAVPVQDAAYSWVGPGNFSSNLKDPTIENVTSIYAGVYTVTATRTGHATKTATVAVSFLQVTPPCSLNNNVCTFTGGLPTSTFTTVYAFVNGDTYQLYASASNGLIITLDFKYPFSPLEGVYNTNGNIFDLADTDVAVDIKPSGFLTGTNVGVSKVYVYYEGGKLTASFCGIPFTYQQFSFTASTKLVEQ